MKLNLKVEIKTINPIDFALLISIAFSVIPTFIIGYIVQERLNNSKHLQLISGLSLTGYWISNFFTDVTKTYVPVGLSYCLMWILKMDYEGVWVLFLIFPPAITLFTYVFSFAFRSTTAAQISVFAITFLVSGILALAVYHL